MDYWNLVLEIVILLGGSLLLGGVFSRFGQSPLVGYLLAGMILGGPGSLHVVRSGESIEIIAELGVALLLFSLGLEFSISRLRKLGGRALAGGVFQVVLTTAVAAGAAAAVGLGLKEAVAVGALVSLSSTAVVLRVLIERAEIDAPHGRNSLAVLLVQDMAVVPLAILLTILGKGGSTGEVLLNLAEIVGLTVGLVAVLYIALNKVAVHALGTLTLVRNRELTMVLSAMTGLASAVAAHSVGVSPALGAFIAGMFLGSSPFATQIRADIAPLRIVLLTLFFGAAGMVADPLWILQHLHIILGLVLFLAMGKTVLTWGIFQALGQPARVAAATGICLAQIGEFAFVLGSIGHDSGILSSDIHLLFVSVAIVSLIGSPFLVPAAPRVAARLTSLFRRRRVHTTAAAEVDGALSPTLVIIGFGPAGQLAARDFTGSPEEVLVLDLNRSGIRTAEELGFRGHIGDATQVEVLEHAHIASAGAVVITIPHHHSAITILEHVRRLAPRAHIVVRSRHQIHTNEYLTAGAHKVIGDEEQVGQSIAGHLKEWLETHAEPS